MVLLCTATREQRNMSVLGAATVSREFIGTTRRTYVRHFYVWNMSSRVNRLRQSPQNWCLPPHVASLRLWARSMDGRITITFWRSWTRANRKQFLGTRQRSTREKRYNGFKKLVVHQSSNLSARERLLTYARG